MYIRELAAIRIHLLIAVLSTFDRITEGYTLHLQKETADAWYILCKKARTNKDKDDPKKMELAVAKATYLPIYLRMKKSFITVSIENVTIGVSDGRGCELPILTCSATKSHHVTFLFIQLLCIAKFM